MKLSLCTISFRHQLISFAEIVKFARHHQFDGIELWGVHAQHLYDWDQAGAFEQLQVLKNEGMKISMLSDYLDISAPDNFLRSLEKGKRLIALAHWLDTKHLRTFAGQKPSEAISPNERNQYVHHLRILCELCYENGIELLLETHPNTLTDNLSSTLALVKEVNHPTLKINLDFLHIYESGADPIESFHQLKPWVAHYHLKNITSKDHFSVFEPHNVYAPSGIREGMVSLGTGVVDYGSILETISDTKYFASIEWFGQSPARVLEEEMEWLRRQIPFENHSLVQTIN
ncbi:sugar phosphate isomerase/epimerase family protein [Brevibacillus daliensis]|uniref:sugar phosphate isomerase/epimerase family protein n=1 Tax=Brevibacillus daliensis TaxID=2892995 RepID=UPI001E2FDDDD|nr:sugar phosphate isomerase/epimerase family protein [Brevibacillus daliensis]